MEMDSIHASGTSRDPSTLLQALKLATAGLLGLALHVVIVVVAAPGADEESRREKGSGGGADLLDRGDRRGERGGVDEHLLVEPARGMEWLAFSLTGIREFGWLAVGGIWERRMTPIDMRRGLANWGRAY
jgi:hypothetical protein